jgi:outer membrane murein-binding lipoprotein Lpp
VPSDDSEVLAQQVSGLNAKVANLEQRMAEVEKVNARLEQAALSTARAMEEISRHWDAVYEAMRRA